MIHRQKPDKCNLYLSQHMHLHNDSMHIHRDILMDNSVKFTYAKLRYTAKRRLGEYSTKYGKRMLKDMHIL